MTQKLRDSIDMSLFWFIAFIFMSTIMMVFSLVAQAKEPALSPECQAAVWQATRRCLLVEMGSRNPLARELCKSDQKKADKICKRVPAPSVKPAKITPGSEVPAKPEPKREEPLTPSQDAKPNEPPKVPEPSKVRPLRGKKVVG